VIIELNVFQADGGILEDVTNIARIAFAKFDLN
jgi:hypothetical protein